MKEVNSLILQFLVENLKSFNINGFENLRTDLSAISNMCKSEFKQYPSIYLINT